ncbi:MAG: hypothetical protein ACYC91_18545 [Solirubrobacteraceae bacterium]
MQRQLDRHLLQRLRDPVVLCPQKLQLDRFPETGRPGFADANAASAAYFASARKRTITDTSTPYFRAASACEISC